MKISHESLGDASSVDALAKHLRELFTMLGIDCVLDVGANKGQYYEFLRDQVGFRGRVISFEPIPDLAEALRGRAAHDSNWTVCDFAVGRKDDVLPLNVTNRSGWSSFLKKADIADQLRGWRCGRAGNQRSDSSARCRACHRGAGTESSQCVSQD